MQFFSGCDAVGYEHVREHSSRFLLLAGLTFDGRASVNMRLEAGAVR